MDIRKILGFCQMDMKSNRRRVAREMKMIHGGDEEKKKKYMKN